MTTPTTYAPYSTVELLIDRLKAEGVTTIFGVPGGAVAPLLDRVFRDPQLRFIMAKHESGAVAMADGYARATGSLGVCVVTTGPGAMNALTHLAVAQADNSSVLLITGQVARASFGRGAFQDSTDETSHITEIFRHAAKYSTLAVSADSFPILLENAIRRARSLPCGAAHLSIPVDLHAAPVPGGRSTRGEGRSWPGGAPAADPVAVGRVSRRLFQARHPLLLLGNGCRRALSSSPALQERLEAFCLEHAIPVATTAKGKGLFAETHPMALGVFGVGGSRLPVSYLHDEPADVVVVVGSGMSEWSSLNWSDALCAADCLAQVDANPDVIGRAYEVKEPVVADAAAFLERLVEAKAVEAEEGRAGARRERVERLRKTAIPYANPELDTSDAIPIKPQRLVHEVGEWLRGGGRKFLFIDAGNSIGWFSQRAKMAPPAELLLPFGTACMGWANAAVVGAKLAWPDLPCATLTGDGGFLMNAVEIATAARYRVGAIWVVANDNYFNTVRLGMRASFGRDYAGEEDFSLGNADLVKVAGGLGADARRVERPGDLRAALEEAQRRGREGRPQLVCVPVDPDEVPPFQERFASIGDGTAKRMLG